jgi:hypothetical protein
MIQSDIGVAKRLIPKLINRRFPGKSSSIIVGRLLCVLIAGVHTMPLRHIASDSRALRKILLFNRYTKFQVEFLGQFWKVVSVAQEILHGTGAAVTPWHVSTARSLSGQKIEFCKAQESSPTRVLRTTYSTQPTLLRY